MDYALLSYKMHFIFFSHLNIQKLTEADAELNDDDEEEKVF